jgi:hypothetical protein
MPLIVCPDCGREVSTNAAACVGCGAPIAAIVQATSAQRSAPPSFKRIYLIVFLAAVPLVLLLRTCSKRDPAEGVDYPTYTAPPRAAPVEVSESVRSAAITRFTGIVPDVRHVEWLDGDFIIAARANGSSWQPVADAACAWIRRQGAPAGFSVIVLEASALQNKRWDQLARARCN